MGDAHSLSYDAHSLSYTARMDLGCLVELDEAVGNVVDVSDGAHEGQIQLEVHERHRVQACHQHHCWLIEHRKEVVACEPAVFLLKVNGGGAPDWAHATRWRAC